MINDDMRMRQAIAATLQKFREKGERVVAHHVFDPAGSQAMVVERGGHYRLLRGYFFAGEPAASADCVGSADDVIDYLARQIRA